MVSTRAQSQRSKQQQAAAATTSTLRLTCAVVGAVLLVVLFLVPRAHGFHVPLQMTAGECGPRPTQEGGRSGGMERRQALAQGVCRLCAGAG